MDLFVNGRNRNGCTVKIKKYNTFFTRFRGLMFRRQPLENEGIWIIPCNSIHMFFMFISIDVVFIDKNLKVVKVFPKVNPWKVIPPVKGAHSVLELPVGTIEQLQLKSGDNIVLKET